MQVQHIRADAEIADRGIQATIHDQDPFPSYFTAITKQDPPSTDKALKALTPLYNFAQAWQPMRKANEVLVKLPRRKRGQHSGHYLYVGKKWWWVTTGWLAHGLKASSTHLAGFAILEDISPPHIGDAQWALHDNIPPRMVLPIHEQGSGIGRVELLINGVEVPYEMQRAWSRVLYQPPQVTQRNFKGDFTIKMRVKDRSGHENTRTQTLSWPATDYTTFVGQEELEPSSKN